MGATAFYLLMYMYTNGYVYNFFVDYNIIDASNIIFIHKHLMKKHNIKNAWVN